MCAAAARRRVLQLAAALLLLRLEIVVRADPPPGSGAWQLTFSDDFDSFNTSLWTKGWSWCNGTGTLPGDPQPPKNTKWTDTCWYDDANVAVANGTLIITNRRQRSHSFNYTSGVVNSIKYSATQGFEQTYGYWEARIKASPGGPHNRGMCPAFWLPNTRNNGDDGNCEIDVVEIPGGPRFGSGATAFGTIHTTRDKNGTAHGNVTLPAGQWWGEAFHDFAVWWSPSFVAWFIDGAMYFNTTHYVPHTPSYMVLDNEIGLGHWEPDGGWAGDPSGTKFPKVMLVDHVRVWAQTPGAPVEPARAASWSS